MKIGELRKLPLDEQFEWYAVDLWQYICRADSKGYDIKAIYIPLRNRLNLSVISLLWGSLWMENVTDPLQNRIYSEYVPEMPLWFDAYVR